MNSKMLSITLITLLLFLAIFHVFQGIFEFKSFFHALFSFDANNVNDVVYREIRFPRMIIAIIAGASLSISGLLLQTFFNNPLAGPSILGISSGSSLFVALSLMSGLSLLQSDLSIVMFSMAGALFFCFIIILFSLVVKNKVSLLLIGMMLASFSNAIIQLFQVSSSTQDLKAFTIWGLGSVQQVGFSQLPLIILIFCISLLFLVVLIKPLNSLILGEQQIQILGFNLKKISLLIIISTSLFTGLITAYCGPIGFIGLAVPNIAKQLFKTQNHFKLIYYSGLIGAILLLICDIIILLLDDYFVVPLNAVTSIIGAPFVVWIILKRF
jgi:iron complex transport system permease protein